MMSGWVGEIFQKLSGYIEWDATEKGGRILFVFTPQSVNTILMAIPHASKLAQWERVAVTRNCHNHHRFHHHECHENIVN